MRRVAGWTLVGFVIAITATLHAQPRKAPRARTGTALHMQATAYCLAGKTQSGVSTRPGIVAADPDVIPVGSVVRIVDGGSSGIYTVLDTGPSVKGKKIDIFIPDCAKAKRFGARRVRVHVLRRGWEPTATTEPQ
jgi:3D (Asp-Asp-Asp) domain-containing protein